eukprot:c53968_g1_i1 orf=72-275(+)
MWKMIFKIRLSTKYEQNKTAHRVHMSSHLACKKISIEANAKCLVPRAFTSGSFANLQPTQVHRLNCR